MELTDPGHFKTTDSQLALALATAGCTLAPQSEGGPAVNMYSPEQLRSIRRLGDTPVSTAVFERAAADAFERRIPGKVTYLFVRDATLQRAIRAWDLMVDEMQRAQDDGRKPELPSIDEETVMRVLYLRRLNEKEFARVPFFNTPLLCVQKTKRAEQPIANRSRGVSERHAPGANEIHTGSAKIWSLGCSAETRKAVGV